MLDTMKSGLARLKQDFYGMALGQDDIIVMGLNVSNSLPWEGWADLCSGREGLAV